MSLAFADGSRRPSSKEVRNASLMGSGTSFRASRQPEHLRADRISKRYGRTQVLHEVSLEVPNGAIVALLGPSGSGKTTLGEILAGTSRCDQGRVLLGDRDVTSAPAHTRGIALAPQEWELFSHLDALENVAFGPWAAGVGRAERAQAATVWLARVGLAGRERAMPSQLSGGQQQRVALARALAAEGPFAVLDEPFANVDQETRSELRRLVCEEAVRGCGIVLITHDRDDALMLADSVVCLHGGRVVMHGTPEEVYWRPRSLEAARLTGEADLIAFDQWKVVPASVVSEAHGTDPKGLSVVVRPEWLELTNDGDAQIVGVVKESSYRGADYLIAVSVGSSLVHIRSEHPLAHDQGIGLRVRDSARAVSFVSETV